MLRFLLLAVAICAASAQTSFPLGQASDPCVGGSVLAVAGSPNNVRYGDFICSFPVGPDAGPQTIQLGFIEPCYVASACAAGGIAIGQRPVSVWVNDQPVLAGYDAFAWGATNAAPSSRTFFVYPASGKLVVRVKTTGARYAALAMVTITPAEPVTVTRAVCAGPQPPTSDCSSIELYLINGVPYVAMMAWPAILQIPACTANPMTQCFQPAPLVKQPVGIPR